MAKKQTVEFRTKTVDELNAQLLELRREQFNLRFQQASGQLENVARFRQIRRDIARTKFILAEKTRAGA